MTMLYISGGINGIDNAIEVFEGAANALRERGFDTLNPFDIKPRCPVGAHGHFDGDGEENNHEWECWLRGDLTEMLDKADGLAMLPRWEASRGARLEHFVALQVGIECRPIHEWRV